MTCGRPFLQPLSSTSEHLSDAMTATTPSRTDIFCRVVDNFGDAGVCWRLAQRFAALGIAPRLIIDRVDVLAKIAADVNPTAKCQTALGVEVVDWDAFAAAGEADGFAPAPLVIETFGCRLPEAYEGAMASSAETGQAPFWINLDYLSAEDWVETCHDVWGLHPTLGIRKLWFFPGFTDRTGGVMVEDDYAARRAAFEAGNGREKLLRSLNADPELPAFFVFCYPVNDLDVLARMLKNSPLRRNVLLAPGEAGDRLEAMLSDEKHLIVRRTPFVPQPQFDEILWSADAGVVRGEDSFVRAQLAALPFLWATYPTEDLAHRIKLNAWLEKRAADERARTANALWVEDAADDAVMSAWLAAADAGALNDDARRWAGRLIGRGDLARHIVARVLQG